jgi:hypothetical protein
VTGAAARERGARERMERMRNFMIAGGGRLDESRKRYDYKKCLKGNGSKQVLRTRVQATNNCLGRLKRVGHETRTRSLLSKQASKQAD